MRVSCVRSARVRPHGFTPSDTCLSVDNVSVDFANGEDSHTPLPYFLLRDGSEKSTSLRLIRLGSAPVQLQRQLGIGSHTTDWYMLHRLRNGMVNEKQSHLSCLAKADETIIGGLAKHKRGRGVTAAKPKDLGHWCSGGPSLSTPWSSTQPYG